MKMSTTSSSFIPAPAHVTRLFANTTNRQPVVRRFCHHPTAVLKTSGAQYSSISEIAEAVRTSKTTAETVLDNTLKRIETIENNVKAFLTIDVEQLHTRAKQIDSLIKQGKNPGPLAGVPIAVKDNLCTKNLPTTAGSAILDGFVPAFDATAVSRLQEAGAILLGKTNMDEFGMGSSTETSAYQQTRNPANLECVPGGSSGGSAAAVAAGECLAALGSDTGGSIRLPASFCGVTGFKPSYGRVSRHGLLAFASSLDTVGPICTNVRDAALMMQVIAGKDGMDGTALNQPVPRYAEELTDQSDLTGVTVGIIEEAMAEGVDTDVAEAVQAATNTLKDMGAKVKTISIPRLSAATAAYYVLAPSEASANLARYDGVRYGVRDVQAENSNQMYARSRAQGFGEEVKRRIMVGTYALSAGYYDAYYLKAQRIRALVVEDFRKAFNQGVDVLISPVAPTPAFKIGEKINDPVSMYATDLMTIPPSLAGLPALTVPCGQSKSGLPIGMQVVGPFLGDLDVLQIGHAFQQSSSYHLRANNSSEIGVAAAV